MFIPAVIHDTSNSICVALQPLDTSPPLQVPHTNNLSCSTWAKVAGSFTAKANSQDGLLSKRNGQNRLDGMSLSHSKFLESRPYNWICEQRTWERVWVSGPNLRKHSVRNYTNKGKDTMNRQSMPTYSYESSNNENSASSIRRINSHPWSHLLLRQVVAQHPLFDHSSSIAKFCNPLPHLQPPYLCNTYISTATI